MVIHRDKLPEAERRRRRKLTLQKYYQSHKVEQDERTRAWRANNGRKSYWYGVAYRKKNKQKLIEYREERSAQKTEATRIWREKNPERSRALDKRLHKEWRARHPERARENVRQRRAKFRALPNMASAQVVTGRVAMFGGLCWICTAPYTEIDHVKPIAAGGAHMGANLRPICRTCNAGKNATWPFDVHDFRRKKRASFRW